jgi:hypothetical protein
MNVDVTNGGKRPTTSVLSVARRHIRLPFSLGRSLEYFSVSFFFRFFSFFLFGVLVVCRCSSDAINVRKKVLW